MSDKQDVLDQVNIEQIMREIRLEILQSEDVYKKIPGLTEAFRGSRFRADVYDHLYQAALSANGAEISIFLTPNRLGVLGRYWQLIRRKWHEIVLSYVTDMGTRQSMINEQLLIAVVELINEAESSSVPN